MWPNKAEHKTNVQMKESIFFLLKHRQSNFNQRSQNKHILAVSSVSVEQNVSDNSWSHMRGFQQSSRAAVHFLISDPMFSGEMSTGFFIRLAQV